MIYSHGSVFGSFLHHPASRYSARFDHLTLYGNQIRTLDPSDKNHLKR